MSSKRWAQVMLIVSISTLIAAVGDEERRLAWVILTTASHISLVWIGVNLMNRDRR